MSILDFVEEGYVHVTEDGMYINRNVRKEHGMKASYEISLVSDEGGVNLVKAKMNYHNDDLTYSGVNTEDILSKSKCLKVRKITGMFSCRLELLEVVDV